ncbi:glycosyltransferase family 39 protein [Candidatus Woesearchaeota archaeon]|nr:glycosyltransferase family 39 protein [Candidatus Woesearchaeota archaeon]
MVVRKWSLKNFSRRLRYVIPKGSSAGKIIILITIAAFLLRVLFIDTSYVFWDEAIYVMNAQAIVEGASPMQEWDIRPPLLPLLLSLTYRSELFSRLFVAFLNSMLVPVAWLLGKQVNRKAGLIAAVTVAVFPFHILASRWLMTDSLSALLMAFGFYLAFVSLKRPSQQSTLLALIGGAAVAMSVLMKFTSLLILAVLAPLYFVRIRDRFMEIIVSAAGFILVMAPYLIWNAITFGSPLHVFLNGFAVVDISDSISFFLKLKELYYFFGPVLIIALVSSCFMRMKIRRKTSAVSTASATSSTSATSSISSASSTSSTSAASSTSSTSATAIERYSYYWLALSLIYFFYILNKGVAAPESMLWEVQRFLFPALVPSVILSSSALSRLKPRSLFVALLLFLVFSFPMLAVAYTPAIEHENGLRAVTKEIGAYLKGSSCDCIYCTGNCPPVAYYSGIRTIYSSSLSGEDAWLSGGYMGPYDDKVLCTVSFSSCDSAIKAYWSGDSVACLKDIN